MKGFGYMEFYMGGDMGDDEIDIESVHAYYDHNHIKNVSNKIETIFNTIIKNYGSTLEEYHI